MPERHRRYTDRYMLRRNTFDIMRCNITCVTEGDMEHNTTEERIEVSYDLMTDLERRARRKRDQYMAACIRAGYQSLCRGVKSVAEGISARKTGVPRQA